MESVYSWLAANGPNTVGCVVNYRISAFRMGELRFNTLCLAAGWICKLPVCVSRPAHRLSSQLASSSLASQPDGLPTNQWLTIARSAIFFEVSLTARAGNKNQPTTSHTHTKTLPVLKIQVQRHQSGYKGAINYVSPGQPRSLTQFHDDDGQTTSLVSYNHLISCSSVTSSE